MEEPIELEEVVEADEDDVCGGVAACAVGNNEIALCEKVFNESKYEIRVINM